MHEIFRYVCTLVRLGSTCFNAKERAGEKISLFDLAKISVKILMHSVLKSEKNMQFKAATQFDSKSKINDFRKQSGLFETLK